MKRKLFATISLLLPLCCLQVSPVLAVLSADDMADNLFSIGNNHVKVVERFDSHPDASGYVTKEVAVENLGEVTLYVRVLVMPEESGSVQAWSFTYDVWQLKEDGYWYYEKPLGAFEKTSLLLNGCTLSQHVDSCNIYVYAESVEAYGANSPEAAFNAYCVKEGSDEKK